MMKKGDVNQRLRPHGRMTKMEAASASGVCKKDGEAFVIKRF